MAEMQSNPLLISKLSLSELNQYSKKKTTTSIRKLAGKDQLDPFYKGNWIIEVVFVYVVSG